MRCSAQPMGVYSLPSSNTILGTASNHIPAFESPSSAANNRCRRSLYALWSAESCDSVINLEVILNWVSCQLLEHAQVGMLSKKDDRHCSTMGTILETPRSGLSYSSLKFSQVQLRRLLPILQVRIYLYLLYYWF